MSGGSTMCVGHYKDTRALLLTCGHHVLVEDVNRAFKEIDDILYHSPDPVYVVIDLRTGPRIPLVATLQAASFGPYRNLHLKEWLMIGSTPVAQTIVRILTATTSRDNVRWFANEDEVSAYLMAQFLHEDAAAPYDKARKRA